MTPYTLGKGILPRISSPHPGVKRVLDTKGQLKDLVSMLRIERLRHEKCIDGSSPSMPLRRLRRIMVCNRPVEVIM